MRTLVLSTPRFFSTSAVNASVDPARPGVKPVGPLMLMALVEQALRARHAEQHGNLRAAAGLTEHRDVGRIAAESGDVVS